MRDERGSIAHFVAVKEDITERKRAERRLAVQGERSRILADAAGRLLANDDPGSMVSELFRAVADHLGVDTCFNFMVNDEGDALRLDSFSGIPEGEARRIERLEFGEDVCGTVAQQRRAIVATDIQGSGDPKVGVVKGYGIRAYACNPLLAGDRLLGTLSFGTKRRGPVRCRRARVPRDGVPPRRHGEGEGSGSSARRTSERTGSRRPRRPWRRASGGSARWPTRCPAWSG